jgi:hypothetical protein
MPPATPRAISMAAISASVRSVGEGARAAALIEGTASERYRITAWRRRPSPRRPSRRLMCYKSAGDEDGKSAVLEDGKSAVRPRRPISSRAATILARRPTSGMVGLQLKIVVSPSRRGAARLAGAIGPQLRIVAHFAPTGVAVFCRLFIGKLTTSERKDANVFVARAVPARRCGNTFFASISNNEPV